MSSDQGDLGTDWWMAEAHRQGRLVDGLAAEAEHIAAQRDALQRQVDAYRGADEAAQAIIARLQTDVADLRAENERLVRPGRPREGTAVMGVLGEKGQRAALDLAIRASRDYAANVPVADDDTRHTFTVTVAVAGEPLVPQTIRAYSLVEALARAIAVPFPDWFPDEPADPEKGQPR